MTKPKNPQTNPIEEAIGNRAKTKEDLKEVAKVPSAKEILRGYPVPEETWPKTEAEKILQAPADVAKQILSETQDEPSPSEMLDLEELNRQTEERLQDQYPEEPTANPNYKPRPLIPASKPDPQPVTETSSQESPPQKNEKSVTLGELHERGFDEHKKAEDDSYTTAPTKEDRDDFNRVLRNPAEEKELVALRNFIGDSGFVASGVAMHIVALCSQPMTVPSTTTWDFADRAMIPDMVFSLLNQPGYLEGIWPSLRIVMADNKGNASWSAGIATTIAFFDVVRTLPAIKELKQCSETEQK